MRRFALFALFPALLVFGSAEAQGPQTTPGASATALAIRVNTPTGATGTAAVSSPPNAAPAAGQGFAYPTDGSIVSAQSTTASAVTAVPKNASAKAESTVTGLSLFGGEVTADAITARASAGTGYSGAGGNALGSAITNLRVAGQPVTGPTVPLGDWGTLTVGVQNVDRTSPAGTHAYHGTVIELDVKLTADHGGLPASSEIQVSSVDVRVQTAPTGTQTTTTSPTTTTGGGEGPSIGDLPSQRPSQSGKSSHTPLKVHPKLTAGHYVFPVYGQSSYIDTFGAFRADVTYHHGDDIFGQLGQPLLACADGTLFSVGWNKIGGNRLWLLDSQGNQFYYAHLSAFAANATNGARVKAGQVIGFMGDTGDAEGTPVHLHFEVHPVSLLYLGYDGAVDPTPYLDAWKHQQDLAFPIGIGWAPLVPGGAGAPEPGAILLGMRDISTADGLDPGSLDRALTPLKRSDLMQTLVPTAVAPPTHDLGKG